MQYGLGDKLLSGKDIIDRRADKGRTHLELISHFEPQDEAFIKRTDGSFTFATVIRRYFDPQDNEDQLVFAVNAAGSTKTIPKRLWKSCIRVKRKQHYHKNNLDKSTAHQKSPRCVKESINKSFSHYPHMRNQDSWSSPTRKRKNVSQKSATAFG